MLLQKINNLRGFTLIELIIVIMIVGILLSIAIPNFIAFRERQKIEQKIKSFGQTKQKASDVTVKKQKNNNTKGELGKL